MITVTPDYLGGLNVNALENSYLYDVSAADDKNVAIMQNRKCCILEILILKPTAQCLHGSVNKVQKLIC